MEELRKNDLFCNDVLNIFTDASVVTINGETISCPGALSVIGDEVIYKSFEILRNSTNNRGEITAILLGIYQALFLRNENNFKSINLFSDSKISVYGLREWIFNWVNNIRDESMYGSSGPIKNQDIIIKTVYTILSNNLNIHLYHVNGHHKSNDKKSINDFRSSFRKNNFLNTLLSDELVITMINYNNEIDNFTRNILLNTEPTQFDIYTSPVQYVPYKFDVNKYKDLLYLK